MKNMLGFDTGVKLGSALRYLLFTNDGMVIAHRIKGRRRYCCNALKGQSEVCAELEAQLQDFPGMTYARVSPVTGSVTVCYECSEKAINALFDALSHQIAGKHAVQEETIIPTGVLTVADNVNDTFQGAKRRLTRFFNHTEPAFLTRIAGMILLIYGFNRIFNNGDRPSGPQILLWGLALLMRRSHPEPKLGNDDEQI